MFTWERSIEAPTPRVKQHPTEMTLSAVPSLPTLDFKRKVRT